MLELFFLRHGQTDFSRENRFCGSIDPPINEVGARMAEAFGAAYASKPWNAIYASTSLRARQTAGALADKVKLPIVTDPGLREVSYGDWEGLSHDDAKQRWPEAYAYWAADTASRSTPGGETAFAVAARAAPVIESESSASTPMAGSWWSRTRRRSGSWCARCSAWTCASSAIGSRSRWWKLEPVRVEEDRLAADPARRHLAPAGRSAGCGRHLIVKKAEVRAELTAATRLRTEVTAAGFAKIEPTRKDDAAVGVADEDEQALAEMMQVLASSRNKKQSELLGLVDRALGKLSDRPDEYGRCEECGEDIAPRRLELMPYVLLCTECQAEQDPKRGVGRKGLTDFK